MAKIARGRKGRANPAVPAARNEYRRSRVDCDGATAAPGLRPLQRRPASSFPPSATTTSRSSPVLSSSLHQAPVHLSRRCPVAEASTCTPARNRGSSRQLLQPLHPCAVTLLKLKMSSSSSDGKLPIPLLLPSCKAAIPLPACSLVLLCSVHSCCSGSSAALLVCFLHLLGPAVCSSSRWCAMLYMCRDSTPACSGGSVDECS